MDVKTLTEEINKLAPAERYELIRSITPPRATLTPEWRKKIREGVDQALEEDEWISINDIEWKRPRRMTNYDIEFSRRALKAYRELELFEAQFVFDLVEGFRFGKFLEGDYDEQPKFGRAVSVVIVSKSAVSFRVNYSKRRVRILEINPADR